jgi:hypothetical protein
MRSDNAKSLTFFKEFANFYKNIGTDAIVFNPIYKYTEPYYYNSEERSEACVMDKYCGAENTKLNVLKPRLILEENMRQKCIHKTYFGTNEYLMKYWQYMIKFAENCADEQAPDFTKTCADRVIICNKI